jgi:LacI family transcriptional regulator
VLSDHAGGMRAATERLIELGHRRIALIVGQPVRPTRQRRQAVEAVFADQGLSADQLIVREGIYSVEHGAHATRELLDMRTPPTALIAGGNQMMLGALRIIAERGLELGGELSFVGCDDLAIASLYRPQIAVVDRDTVALGQAAADLVLTHLRDPAAVRREVILPTTFIDRPSVGPATR